MIRRASRADPWSPDLASSSEPGIALFQQVRIWVVGRSCGQDEAAAVHALKSVFQRRSVAFVENVASDFDHVLGCDAHDQRIECAVVDRAHRDAVRHDGLAGVRIFADVRRVEEFTVTAPAERTSLSVGDEDTPAEVRLMEPATHHRKRVLAATCLVDGTEQDIRLPR
jgi:hypothetical protein